MTKIECLTFVLKVKLLLLGNIQVLSIHVTVMYSTIMFKKELKGQVFSTVYFKWSEYSFAIEYYVCLQNSSSYGVHVEYCCPFTSAVIDTQTPSGDWSLT